MSDENDPFEDIADIIGWDIEVIEDMAEVAFFDDDKDRESAVIMERYDYIVENSGQIEYPDDIQDTTDEDD